MLRVWVYDVFNNTISNAADVVALLVTPQDGAPSLTAGVVSSLATPDGAAPGS
jgi:hypothetical protein